MVCSSFCILPWLFPLFLQLFHLFRIPPTYTYTHTNMPSTNTSRQSPVSPRDRTVCSTKQSKRLATRTIADTNQTNDNTHSSTRSNKDDKTMRKKRCITSLTARNQDELWVDISNKRLPNSRLGALYAGSRFVGIQECGNTSYEVVVDIQVGQNQENGVGRLRGNDRHHYYYYYYYYAALSHLLYQSCSMLI